MANALNSGKTAIVAGVGDGLGVALCKRLLAEGYAVAGLSRTATPQPELGDNYLPLTCDLTTPAAVDNAVASVERRFGAASVYIHNAAFLLRKDFLQTSTEDFSDLWQVVCLGAVNGVQRVLPKMLAAESGTILLTGATASIKAGAGFAAFASAKFALRGLAQSLAREYAPQGIHVAHIIVDGAIWGKQAENFGRTERDCLSPEAIADTYLHLINQHRSAWTQELDLRPDVERF
jgi:NAD(P)-dependent dehydrogenase (short-subunit alcohol dehydrogenase family)